MKSSLRRIAFAGTPTFAATILARMLAADLPICAVMTQPDRPAGRGRRLTASPVKQLAALQGLPLLQMPSLRRPEALEALADFGPDLLVVAAYGLILPPAVLDLPRHGCLNVHASLLPRWRGAAPVERAIMAGDAVTGVCIMEMEAGLDTGPVRHCRERPIGALETGGEVEAALAILGAEALIEVLRAFDDPRFEPRPQPEQGVTYAEKITRDDARIAFDAPADAVARRIRALNPKQPVAVQVNGVRMQLLRASANPASPPANAVPGTLCALEAERLVIACGEGCLELFEARLIRGKAREMDAATLRRTAGDLLVPGVRLEPI